MSIRKEIINRRIKVDVIVANKSNTSISKIYTGIIDTGSVESLISEKVISDLKISQSGEFVTIVDSSNREVKSNRHPCYLMFDGHNKTFDMNIGIIHRKDIDLIIGMDILELVEINIQDRIFTIL